MAPAPMNCTISLIATWLLLVLPVLETSAMDLRSSLTPRLVNRYWGRKTKQLSYLGNIDSYTQSVIFENGRLRGGAKQVADSESESEEESSSSEEEAEVDEKEEEETESETEDESENEEEEEEIDSSVAVTDTEFDEPLMPNPMMQMYATFGIMILSRKIDLYNPRVVRMARFAFIGYLVILQIFVIYVRIKAKTNNDRTPVSVSNPLTNMLQSQFSGGQDGSNAMMKNLASSFLSSESTVMEYDMKQAKSMQGGLLFNMIFMWILHFKMEQLQPLLIQTMTGMMNLIYSPLFQVYVMDRNLERPFKNPAMKKFEENTDEKEGEPEESEEPASTNKDDNTEDETTKAEETKTAEEDETDIEESEDESESGDEEEED